MRALGISYKFVILRTEEETRREGLLMNRTVQWYRSQAQNLGFHHGLIEANQVAINSRFLVEVLNEWQLGLNYV